MLGPSWSDIRSIRFGVPAPFLRIESFYLDDGAASCSQLVPLNRRYPLADVERAAAEFYESKGRRVSLEWTMIDGVNDTSDQARKLAALAQRLRAHINLIALNATPLSPMRPSPPDQIAAFAEILRSLGANVTIRNTRGSGIDAACGQLRALESPRRNRLHVTSG